MFKEKETHYFIEEFEKYGIMAVYTKKNAGNMSDFCPNFNENEVKQKKNRENIFKELSIIDKIEVFSYQTHSNNIKIIRDDENKYIFGKEENIDGFITKRNDVVLCTFYADCLPIFAYDIENKVIGIAHSGWQGTYNEIMKKLILLLEKEFNSNEKNILIGLGIGISVSNYEVGFEFYEKFKLKFKNKEYEKILEKSFSYDEKTNKYYFDNTLFNKMMAIKLGILEKNIIVSSENTYDLKFHSYRREKEKSGRAMALITIK